MNLVLLCVCSIVLARVLSKKMMVASIAHSILFIMMSVHFLLASENEYIMLAMETILGKQYYEFIHNGLIEVSQIYSITMIALFSFELLMSLFTAFFAVLFLVRKIEETIKHIRSQYILDDDTTPTYKLDYNPSMGLYNKQGTYLVLAQLRN